MKELRAKPAVDHLMEEAGKRVKALADRGITPTLAVVRVGRREDDLAYESSILKRFEKAGASVRVTELPEDVSGDELGRKIKELDADAGIHGILLFRPLPRHLNEQEIKNLVSPEKDVDCMSDLAAAHVFAQDGCGFPPCTPEAVVELLKFYEIPLIGKKVTVVGRSMVVGRPLAMLLLKENATVTICHTRTEDLEGECRRADIICAAAGSAGMIGPDHVRIGQTVMDVGINVSDGRLCGDVDFEKVCDIVDAITPVPGGVGSMTTTMLLCHVLTSAERLLKD